MQSKIDLQCENPLYEQVADMLRTRIESGEYKPDERLPSENELCESFKVSHITVRRALLELRKDGRIYGRQGSGTFARALPVEKPSIGLLFGPTLTNEPAHYYRAMLKAFLADISDRNYTCRTYDGLHGDAKTWEELRSYRQFHDDLRRYRFAGLIEFANSAEMMLHLSRQLKLPKVWFHPNRPESDVFTDSECFGREAVGYFARKGRKRIVFISEDAAANPSRNVLYKLDTLISAAHKLELPPPRLIPIPSASIGAGFEREVFDLTAETIRGWQAMPVDERPDALLVCDDIAMRAVAMALLQAGIRVPEDLLILTFASEGIDLHYGIPVARYESSPRMLARAMVDLLWKRMRAETAPPQSIVCAGTIKEPAAMRASDGVAVTQEVGVG